MSDSTRPETREGSILMHEEEQGTPRQDAGANRGTNMPKLLRTGTYLHAYCPVCGADLVEDRLINFEVLLILEVMLFLWWIWPHAWVVIQLQSLSVAVSY